MAHNKEDLHAKLTDLTAQIQAIQQELQQSGQANYQGQKSFIDNTDNDVSEAETIRSMAPIDKLNAKLTYDLTMLNAFENIEQSRRHREEQHNIRMREAEATLRYNNAKWQQELRHADIATESQWVDGADPLDAAAVGNAIDDFE